MTPKLWLHIAATIFVTACIIGITATAAYGDTTPPILAIAALSALAGSFALISVPNLGIVIVAIISIAAVILLSLLHVAVPTSITEILVVAVTGHFALTLPNPPVVTTTTSVAMTATPIATAPASSTIGGQ